MIYIDEYKNLEKYKKKIYKSKSIDDVINVHKEYTKLDKDYYNNMENIILKSFINPKYFTKKINELLFVEYLQTYDSYTLLKMTDDIAQINIINKHVLTKYQSSKKCPHCGILFSNKTGEKYIICGYTGNVKGYDWKGCKRDWCFDCGKKLCKVWDFDELYDIGNRVHNNCCKKYAKKYNIPISDFCKCKCNKIL